MSCFLYASRFPSFTLCNNTSHPIPNPNSAFFPDLPFDFPAVERDYMGIGLGLKAESVNQKTQATTSNSVQLIASSIPSSVDSLCGSHLKLAPPSSSADDGDEDDGESLSGGNVGWPPISSYRKATTRSLSIKPSCNNRETLEAPPFLVPQAPLLNDNNNNDEYSAIHHDIKNEASSLIVIEPFPSKQRKPLHIKVSMDGTPIMRKLDLESMQGYHHLSLELLKLFKFYKRNLSCEVGVHSNFKGSNGVDFILAYKVKDKDGHWMLVGDTPWEIFAHSARRLRMMKKVK